VTVLINPGSGGVPAAGHCWTNTVEEARREAERWLRRIREDGITHVTLLPEVLREEEGRWTFGFRHDVTGVVVELETPGIDNLEAYRKERIFYPRIYWRGSSSSEPRVEHWAADGFEVMKTFRRASA
jgi:hypothetical protein